MKNELGNNNLDLESSSTSSSSDFDINDEEFQRRQNVIRRLKAASMFCLIFLIVEVIGGLLSGSLAILSDAAHLTADLTAFAVAIVAFYLASLPSTSTHTFGLKRAESLAALFSMVSLALISIGLAIEAIRRLWPILFPSSDSSSEDAAPSVDGRLMSGVATIGVVVNIILAFILGEHHVHMPGSDHGHDHDHCHDHGGHGHSHDHHHDGGHDDGHNNHQTTSTSRSNDHNDAHNHHDHDHHDEENACHNHDHSHTDEHANEPLLNGNGSHKVSTSRTDKGYGSTTSSDDVLPIISHNDELPPKGIKHNNHHHKEEKTKTKPHRNINLHAAYIHVLGDLLQSVAVLIAGLVIWYNPDWKIVDPIATLIFCCIVFYSTLGVIRSGISVLLEEVPPTLDWKTIYNSIKAVEHVSNVHDLHIWSISHGIPTLSVHVIIENVSDVDIQESDNANSFYKDRQQDVLQDIQRVCQSYGIDHATIQIQHHRPLSKYCDCSNMKNTQCNSDKCCCITCRPSDDDVDCSYRSSGSARCVTNGF